MIGAKNSAARPPSTSTPPLWPIAACSEPMKLMVSSTQPTSQMPAKIVASV
ncbi:hypothetical protein ES707_11476 [subsurface metagenome]